MDRISRSLELVGKSFQVLRSDKELLFFPAMSLFLCICSSLGILAAFAALYPDQLSSFWAPAFGRPVLTQEMWAAMFLLYLVNSFVVIFFNVGLVSAASDRLAGGKSSVDHGLQVAWSRKWRILEWAVVSATVGMVLRALERRLGRWGRLATWFIGAAWAFATFFVVPLLAAEDIGPMQAIERSTRLMRETWGEEIVGGISIGYIFALLTLPGIFIPILLGRSFGMPGVLWGIGLAGLYWLLLSAVSSAAHGIFMAALYRYATTKEISGPYRSGDFKMVWQPK